MTFIFNLGAMETLVVVKTICWDIDKFYFKSYCKEIQPPKGNLKLVYFCLVSKGRETFWDNTDAVKVEKRFKKSHLLVPSVSAYLISTFRLLCSK